MLAKNAHNVVHWFGDVQLSDELLQCEGHSLQLFLRLTFLVFHNITVFRITITRLCYTNWHWLLLVVLCFSNILLLLLLSGALFVVLCKLVCIKAGEPVHHGLAESSGKGSKVEGLVVKGLVHLCHFNPIRREKNGPGEVLS